MPLTTAQFHSTEPKFGSHACANPACDMSKFLMVRPPDNGLDWT